MAVTLGRDYPGGNERCEFTWIGVFAGGQYVAAMERVVRHCTFDEAPSAMTLRVGSGLELWFRSASSCGVVVVFDTLVSRLRLQEQTLIEDQPRLVDSYCRDRSIDSTECGP